MSKNKLPDLTYEERRKLAGQVRSLRTEAGMRQAELAELAGITRQALSNIERGAVPQIDNLRRIYEVLGVDIAPVEFSEETRQWLAIVGGIMDSMPEGHRANAGKAAVAAVTQELVSLSNVSGTEDDAEARKQGDHALAAFDKKKIKRREDDSEFF